MSVQNMGFLCCGISLEKEVPGLEGLVLMDSKRMFMSRGVGV